MLAYFQVTLTEHLIAEHPLHTMRSWVWTEDWVTREDVMALPSCPTFPREGRKQIKEQMGISLENNNWSYKCPVLLLFQQVLNSLGLAKSVCFTKNALTIS